MVGEILIHSNTCNTWLRFEQLRFEQRYPHKCKHPLNPTELYVSGWVESSRSVLNEESYMFGCYVNEMMRICLIACWICWLALAYPFCCNVVMYVAILSCDDHQLGWWEQMGEVLVASKGTMIQQLSHPG